jgi:hypothetical protein
LDNYTISKQDEEWHTKGYAGYMYKGLNAKAAVEKVQPGAVHARLIDIQSSIDNFANMR